MKNDVKDKKTKKKTEYIDDGHTVYDMSNVPSGTRVKKQTVSVTKGERRAMIKAAFAYYLPIFLGAAACFFAAALLVRLWLN